MLRYKTGKKPARRDAVKLKFASYFKSSALPPVPKVFGRPWLIRNFGMLGNDQYGCCVWAGFAHETMLLRADADTTVPMFTTNCVLRDYAACTGFNPNDPSTDQGTDVQEAAAYRQKTGIIDALRQRHQIDIYTALTPGNLTQLAAAVYFLGAAGVGVNLPDDAEDQFDRAEPWSIGGTHTGNGHYISCIGRNSLGNFLFVSWGRLQAATPEWVYRNMDEGLAFVSRERLKATGLSPQGFDLAALEDDFQAVTSS